MGFDPNSLTDFLKSRGLDHAFAARRRIWESYKPLEPYSGTAAQNSDLLRVLKARVQEPTLLRTKSLYALGEDVQVVVSAKSAVKVVSSFGMPEFEAEPGELINFGKLETPGVFPLHFETEDGVTSGSFMVVPDGQGKVRVELWHAPLRYPTPPDEVDVDDADELLVTRFFERLTGPDGLLESVVEAAKQAHWTADRIFGYGIDIVVGIGVTALVKQPRAVALYWGAAGGVWVLDGARTFFETAIDKVAMTDDEKLRLRILLLGGLTAAETSVNLFSFRQSPKGVCRGLAGC